MVGGRELNLSSFLMLIGASTSIFFWVDSKDVFNLPKLWVLLSATIGFLLFCISRRGLVKDFTLASKSQKALFLVCLFAICGFTVTSFMSESSTYRILVGLPGRTNGIVLYICIFLLVMICSVKRNSSTNDNLNYTYSRYFIFLSIVIGGYSLIQAIGLDPVNWNNPYSRVIGTFGNPNFAAAAMGILSTVTLMIAIETKSFFYKLGLFGLATLLTCLTFFTMSLQGPLISAIGASLILLRFIRSKLSRLKFIFILCTYMFLASFLALSFLGFGPLAHLLEQPTLILRTYYWRVAFQISAKYPLTGMGPDSYVEGFRLLRSPQFVSAYTDDVIADSAHNAGFNILANFGWINYGLYCFIVAYISIKAIRILSLDSKPPLHARVLAVSWLLSTFQSQFTLDQIGLVALQWVSGAALLHVSNPWAKNDYIAPSFRERKEKKVDVSQREFRQQPKGLSTELALVAMILSLFASWPVVRDSIQLNRISAFAELASQGQILETIDEQVAKISQFSKLEARNALIVADLYLAAQRFSDAQVLLDKVSLVEPNSADALQNLAAMMTYFDDSQRALFYRQKLELIDPEDTDNLIGLAELHRRLGNSTESQRYAMRVITLYSKFPQDPNYLKAKKLVEAVPKG